jgi:hypothetical protein
MPELEFFLASISKGWVPRIAAVYKAGEVVAVLYGKERVISGVSTGVVYVDTSLDDVFPGPAHSRHTFSLAIQALLSAPGIRGLRLRLVPGSRELDAVGQLRSGLKTFDCQYSRIQPHQSHIWKDHAHLLLPGSYEQFLAQLGSTTRHNFRYYRRRFEASGHSFVSRLSIHDLRSGALALGAKSKLTDRLSRNEIDHSLNLVAASPLPWAVGLKHRSGTWMSVAGGWYRAGKAVLLFQFNNEYDFVHESIGLVLRAYLIEAFIRQERKELVIFAGTGPPLVRYATFPRTIGVHLDARTWSWRTLRSLFSTFEPWLPERLANTVRWVADPRKEEKTIVERLEEQPRRP